MTLLLQLLAKKANAGYAMPAKAANRALLLSEDSFATPLFLLALDRYGPAMLEWSPTTVQMELEQDFQLRLPKISLDKIFAAVTIVTTNYFYKDVTRFVQLCNILAGDDFQPDEFEPADAEEMLIGITEAMLLWPPDDDAADTEFSEEIREYIRQMLNVQGFLKPFDVLRVAFDNDQTSRVDTEFADDPEMYSAIYQAQQSKTAELRDIYLQNVTALAQQLQLLQLNNGSTTKIVQQLQNIVQQAQQPI